MIIISGQIQIEDGEGGKDREGVGGSRVRQCTPP